MGHTSFRCLTGYRRVVVAASKNKSPSAGAKLEEFCSQQGDTLRAFYDGRYRFHKNAVQDRIVPPVELYCSPFARFKARLSDPTFEVPDDIESLTADFMFESSALFEDEDQRFDRLTPQLEGILGIKFMCVDITKAQSGGRGGGRPDGIVFDMVGDSDGGRHEVVLAVKEEKNEPGMGGCDPAVQGALSLQKVWLRVST